MRRQPRCGALAGTEVLLRRLSAVRLPSSSGWPAPTPTPSCPSTGWTATSRVPRPGRWRPRASCTSIPSTSCRQVSRSSTTASIGVPPTRTTRTSTPPTSVCGPTPTGRGRLAGGGAGRGASPLARRAEAGLAHDVAPFTPRHHEQPHGQPAAGRLRRLARRAGGGRLAMTAQGMRATLCGLLGPASWTSPCLAGATPPPLRQADGPHPPRRGARSTGRGPCRRRRHPRRGRSAGPARRPLRRVGRRLRRQPRGGDATPGRMATRRHPGLVLGRGRARLGAHDRQRRR